MALLNISNTNISFSEVASISFPEYMGEIKPLVFFILGIVVYSVFIFKFYKFVAKRDAIKLGYKNTSGGFIGSLVSLFFYLLENIIVIPIFVFLWFGVMAVLLLVISKSPSPDGVLLTAMSLVAAIRIASYYNESLSQDLAKMIPFALLGVFIVDASYFSLETSIGIAKQIPLLWKLLIYYLLFVIVLEFILTILNSIINVFRKERFEKELS